jgi:hypothetical protein
MLPRCATKTPKNQSTTITNTTNQSRLATG